MADQKIAVVTDSTANLPPELVEKYDIPIIPLTVNWEGKSYLDGVDIQAGEFYDRLSKAKDMPTTSQPSPGQFVEFFTEVGKTADAIVGVFISNELSGTLASAHTAARELSEQRIEIIDSRSASMGLGLMVLEAARLAEQGEDVATIVGVVEAMVSRMQVLFVVDTLEYLHRGGRIGGAQRLLGSLLSIKPVLHLKAGVIEPLASVRTKKKALEHLIDTIAADTAGKSQVRAAVLGAAAPADVREVRAQLEARVEPEVVLEADMSPVIGTHTGPGTVGVGYYVAAGLNVAPVS